MSPGKLPLLSARQLIAILEHLGFQETKLKATSHRRYVHPDGRKTTVPVHSGQDIGRGLLRKILRDIKLNREEFEEFL